MSDRAPVLSLPLPPASRASAGTPTSVARVSLVDLQRITDARGDLLIAQLGDHMPFTVRRMYALLNVPENSERGGHAHRELSQLLVVLSGSLDLIVDDGARRQRIRLGEDSRAVHIRPMVWRELAAFSEGTVCVVLASEVYDEADYIRDYREFVDELGRLPSVAAHLESA